MTGTLRRFRAQYSRWKLKRARRRCARARRERKRLERLYPEGETMTITETLYELIRLIWMQTVRWIFP